MKLAMVIDSSRCIDCKACLISCATAHNVPEGQHRNWIKVKHPDVRAAKPDGHFQPGACMHCAHAVCVMACPTGATVRRAETGEVIIHQDMCIGCGSCLPACPYGARYLRQRPRVADKCDYCASRRAQGLDPACVGTCPTKARTFGDLDDPTSPVAHRWAQGPVTQLEYPGYPTDPAMYYVKATAPVDWPRKPEEPAPIRALTSWIGPAMHALVGLTGLGLLAALGRRLLLPDTSEDTPSDGRGGKEHA